MAKKNARMKSIKLSDSLFKGGEMKALARPKVDPGYRKLTEGLEAEINKMIKNPGKYGFTSCCVEGCCVSWCCVQIS